MAWMQCRSCSTKFAVGLLRCPQCNAVSELFAVPEEVLEAEQEAAAVPKISVEGGASNALGQDAEPETVEAEQDEPTPVETETSNATPAVTNEAPAVNEGADATAGSESEPDAAPAPKPARKTAAKKAAAKAEPAPTK